MQVGRNGRKKAFGVIWDKKVAAKVKGNVYKCGGCRVKDVDILCGSNGDGQDDEQAH